MKKTLGLAAIWVIFVMASCLACQARGSIAKTCRTTLTDEAVSIAHQNIAKYDWAKKIVSNLKDGPIRSAHGDSHTTATDLLAVPDDQLWELMPDTSIYRDYYVSQLKGCPVHGVAIKKFDVFHPWRYDPIHKPFKMQCPVGGEWYPSNDFAHGDMTSGDFPDDGTGFKKDGNTYFFIGEYSHMIYLTAVRVGLDRLTQLYVLTGDRRYARKAAVLLLRIAQQFPNSTDKSDRCYRAPYGFHSGLVTDCIWSCADVEGLATDYDLLFDALDDPEILAFASRKTPSIKTGDDFRAYVDANILRVGAQALMDRAVAGNLGMHQQTAAVLSLVMDDVEGKNHPDSRELMDWLYYKSSGPARTFARNSLLKDGGGAESTGYNGSRLALLPMAREIEMLRARHPGVFPVSRYPDLLAEPKVLAMADYFTDMMLLDRFYPSIGDSKGETVKPTNVARGRKTVLPGIYAEQYYRRFGDDQFAQMLMATDGSIAHTSIYEPPIDDEVRAVVKRLGQFPKHQTSMLDGYGIAFARSGQEEDQRVAWVYYGGSQQHMHHDDLNLAYEAKGLVLLPELGYPKSWDFSPAWESNMLTHNTVVIDRRPGPTRDCGRLLALQSVPGIQLMDVQQDPYRAADAPFGEPERLFRRTSLLMDLSPEDSYLVDLFRVKGGTEHWQSWHGTPVKATFEGPPMTAQARGTLAGEDVEYAARRTGPNGKPALDVFSMFTNVERGEAAVPWSLDYDMGVKRVHTRITGLPEPGTELITADGRAPSDPNDYTIRYSFACRKGEKPLRSQFLTVVEPYTEKRIVDRIQRLAPTGKGIQGFSPTGVRVNAGPREDTILTTGSVTGAARLGAEIALKGDTGVVRKRGGKFDSLFLSGGTYLSCGAASIGLTRAELPGKIASVDRVANEITVSMAIGYPAALIGRRIRIYNELRGVAYTIVAAHEAGSGLVRLKLNTTSLLGEGTSDGVGDGAVSNGVMLDFAGLRYAEGKWQNICSVYTGSRIEDESGKVSLLVLGVRTDAKYKVVLDPKTRPSDAQLAKLLPAGTEFRLYDYGPGDAVSIPCLASLSATGETGYALEATDEVILSLPGKRIMIRPNGGAEWTCVSSDGVARIPLAVSHGKAEIRVEP